MARTKRESLGRSLLGAAGLGVVLFQATCTGDIGGDDAGGGTEPPGSVGPGVSATEVSSSALRRLSVHELANTLRTVVGEVPEAIERLPPDGLTHSFDRVVNSQTVSPAHLEALSAIASEVAGDLMMGARLDELVSACPDSSIPSLVRSVTKTVDGNAFSLSPTWAVSTSSNPKHATIVYAPDPVAVYAHSFSAPGPYELRLDLHIQGPVDTLEVRVDNELAATRTNLDGDQTVAVELSIAESGSHTIELSFQTNPDDHGLRVVFKSLSIEGPLASMAAPADADVKACATSIVDELAPVAYRRPLSDAERQRLLALYDDLAREHGTADALFSLLEAIFSSPHFVFLVEIGEPVAGEPGLFRLGPWELASRLSYAICEGPPDAELIAAARAGELATPEQIEAQARRLFAEPCAKATVERFLEHWLWLNRLPKLNKSQDAFPEFTSDVRDGLVAESKRLLSELVWRQDAGVAALFEARFAYPDPRSAFLYGLPSADGEQTSLPPERAGILTSPSILAVTGTFDGTSPVHRGVYVLEQMLCSRPPPPPGDVEIVPPPPDPALTTRERWAAHSDDPVCSSCHRVIDPVGFAFEEFDGIGRHRTEENGHPVDASGGIPTLGLEDGSLVGGAELSRALASAMELRSCLARQWLRFSFGRLETAADEATLAELAAAFDAQSLREALVSIVSTPAFMHRHEDQE